MCVIQAIRNDNEDDGGTMKERRTLRTGDWPPTCGYTVGHDGSTGGMCLAYGIVLDRAPFECCASCMSCIHFM